MALRLALVLALLLLGSYSGVQCQQATTETGKNDPSAVTRYVACKLHILGILGNRFSYRGLTAA